eukprot:8927449-Alexandrium_andersonii.AAC.1
MTRRALRRTARTTSTRQFRSSMCIRVQICAYVFRCVVGMRVSNMFVQKKLAARGGLRGRLAS